VEEKDVNAIEKALRKAREAATSTQISQTSPDRRSHAKVPVPPPIGQIRYSETRVEKVSTDQLHSNRLVAGMMLDNLADTYRLLRAQVLKRLQADGGSTVAVCSANTGEGKTLTAANLAISMAMDPNHTVLLVDLDLRRPRIQQYFGIGKIAAGLCDYLEGNAELSDALINPGIDGLVLLPVRRALVNSSELLSSPRMLHLLSELKGRYSDRVVIYDLPPLLATDDSLVVLPHIDASLLVVREGGTRAGEIQRSMRLLDNHNLLGTVLNGSADANLHVYY
jgi:capsular exopolysaccharide synthesis family protein